MDVAGIYFLNIMDIVRICAGKIKDDLLLFSVIAILVIVSFPDFKTLVFIVYLVSAILYSIVKGFAVYRTNGNNRFLENFKKFFEKKENWEKRIIDNRDVYFYKEDNNYKIDWVGSNREWTARESWMEKFPDPHICEHRVLLKHGESSIEEFVFLSCDGGRYFIPMPEKRCIKYENSHHCLEFEYFWRKNSPEYKIGEVIGDFYREDNLAGVAEFCRIKLED